MKLKDCIAVVTGATSGMGESAAKAIALAGGKVALIGRNAAIGEKNVLEIGSDKSVFIKTDVSKEDEVQSAIKKAVEHFGYINAVVNCAGIGPAKRILSRDGVHSLELFMDTIMTNLVGTFNMIRFGAQAMTQSPQYEDGERGVIINTASFAIYGAQIGQAAYVASKGGIAAMTLPIARELAQFGIRCNTIAPGMVDTPMFDGLGAEVIDRLIETTIFPKRFAKSEEYASLVLEVIRNTFINGTIISIDGAVRLSPK